jgi:hypothetical protein
MARASETGDPGDPPTGVVDSAGHSRSADE